MRVRCMEDPCIIEERMLNISICSNYTRSNYPLQNDTPHSCQNAPVKRTMSKCSCKKNETQQHLLQCHAVGHWWYLLLNFSGAKLYPREQNQVFEKRVQTSTSSYSNQWVTSLNVMANRQALSHKHMIHKESLSCGSLYTWE